MFLKYKNIKGFSFTEVVVSITLLLVVLVCISGVYYYCKMGAKKATELSQCMHLAQWKMAEVIYLSESQISTATNVNFPAPFDSYKYTIQKLTPSGTKLTDFTEIKVTATGSTGAKVSLIALMQGSSPYAGYTFLPMMHTGVAASAVNRYGIYAINFADNFSTYLANKMELITNTQKNVIYRIGVSPDGKKLIFLNKPTSSSAIQMDILDLKTKQTTRFYIKDSSGATVYNFNSGCDDFKFSPANNSLSFWVGNKIYITDQGGTISDTIDFTPAKRSNVLVGGEGLHSWDKTGENLVYTSTSGSGDSGNLLICKYNLSSKTSTQIFFHPMYEDFGGYYGYNYSYSLGDISYSPDGNKIAFLLHRLYYHPYSGALYYQGLMYVQDSTGTKNVDLNFLEGSPGTNTIKRILTWNKNGDTIYMKKYGNSYDMRVAVTVGETLNCYYDAGLGSYLVRINSATYNPNKDNMIIWNANQGSTYVGLFIQDANGIYDVYCTYYDGWSSTLKQVASGNTIWLKK